MIISNCPRGVIDAAITKTAIRGEIESLSGTGQRHRVKLKPSHVKDIKVEAGTRVFYKYNEAHRDRLHRAFAQLGLDTNPQTLLDSTYDDKGSYNRFSHIPEPVLLQAIHLAKGICGTTRVVHKKIAKYQRRALSNHDRACAALCWHGFRDFFLYLFEAQPNASAFTGIAKYKGKAGFLEKYPGTESREIGSQVNPMLISEACWCEE